MSQAEPGADALTPEQSLALIAAQSQAARRSLRVDDRLLYATWGIAWVLAYGATYLVYGVAAEEGRPEWVVTTIWPVAMTVALVVTIWHVRTIGAGVRGSTLQGAMLGISFLLSAGGGAAIGALLIPDGIHPDQAFLYPSAGIVLGIGVLYMGQAAVFADPLMFALGAWLVVADGLAIAVGWESYALAMAVGGGGGFLVAAGIAHVAAGRGRARHEP